MRWMILVALVGCTADDTTPDTATDTGDTAPAGPAPFPEGITPVHSILEGIRAAHDVPALGGLRIEGGEVTHLGVAGVRHRTEGEPAWWDDRWHLGSCTKAMTGTLVARLVEQGELTWDEPLSTLLPNTAMRSEYATLTVVELLSHQAGLPTSPPSSVWNPLWEEGEVTAQRAAFAADILDLAPAQAIGTYAYSNAGYMVVGAALEARTGKSWEQLTEEELFTPLDMPSCGFGHAPTTHAPPDEPWPHTGDGTPVDPNGVLDNPPALGPAGTVHCSLVDWSRFVDVHVRDDTSYLPQAQWDQLHTAQIDGYAMGWGIADRAWADGTVYTHSGSNTMNFAVVWAAPELDAAYLAVTNQGDAAAVTDAAIGSLIGQ